MPTPAIARSSANREPALAGLLPAAALAAFVAVAGAVAYYAPPATGEMAVVFPIGTPATTGYELILEQGGSFVGGSQLPNVLVAYAPDAGFAERIRRAGALFTLAAHGLCGPVLPDTTKA